MGKGAWASAALHQNTRDHTWGGHGESLQTHTWTGELCHEQNRLGTAALLQNHAGTAGMRSTDLGLPQEQPENKWDFHKG